jgi:hypothetical protein
MQAHTLNRRRSMSEVRPERSGFEWREGVSGGGLDDIMIHGELLTAWAYRLMLGSNV